MVMGRLPARRTAGPSAGGQCARGKNAAGTLLLTQRSCGKSLFLLPTDDQAPALPRLRIVPENALPSKVRRGSERAGRVSRALAGGAASAWPDTRSIHPNPRLPLSAARPLVSDIVEARLAALEARTATGQVVSAPRASRSRL
jgi:hypothetical protein